MLKRETLLPFALPTIGDAEIAEVVDTLKSGWLSTGPKVRDFESRVAQTVKASEAVAVSSCTAGLHLSLVALGVGPGDEVLVPTLTFCATANVVEHVGATPVLVDVGFDGNINVAAAEALVSDRTKAIVPVHFAGQAADLDAVYKLAEVHDLAVIEDAAHAIGADYRGVPIGADRTPADLRRTVVYSFYATKNMTTGEGGMVVTDDAELARTIRSLALHGMSRDAWKRYSSAGSWFYEVTAPGFKANMTDIQAAIGIHQLARLDGFIEDRRRQAALYDTALADVDAISLLDRHDDRGHAYHLYVIRVRSDRLTVNRDRFIELLREYNIGTSVHFIPVHTHPHYRDTYRHPDGRFPVADEIFSESVSLPLHPRLSDEDIGYVSDVVRFLIQETLREK